MLLFHVRRRTVRLLLSCLIACASHVAVADVVYPLKISTNGRFLTDQSGVPFLVNGDTAWTLVNELSRAQVSQYFQNCQANGINAVMWEMTQPYTGYSPDAPNNAEGNPPFNTPNDFSTPNAAYWDYIDFVIDEAATYGIVLFSFPSYVGQGDGWYNVMPTNDMAAYGAWIGNRYKDKPNIVWSGGGDQPVSGGLATAHNAMMNAIKAADPNHIMTAHSNRTQSALDDYNEPWLDLNSTYSQLSSTLSESETDWNRIGTAPTFFLEGDYQPDISDQQARFQAYAHIIGGGSGHFYGHHTIWDFNSGWESALNTPGRTSLLHLSNLFASRPYHDIVPDYAHTLVTAGYGDFSSSFAVMSGLGNGGDTLLAYFPGNSYTITVDMSQIGGTTSDVHWFNVRDGSASFDGNYANSGTMQFTPPGSGDWLLVVDNAARGLGAPGEGAITPTVPNPPENLAIEINP